MKTLLTLIVLFAAATSSALAQSRGHFHAPPSRNPYRDAPPASENSYNHFVPYDHRIFAFQGGRFSGQADLADSLGECNGLALLVQMNELQMQQMAQDNQWQNSENQRQLRKMQAELREAQRWKRMALARDLNAARPRPARPVSLVAQSLESIDWPMFMLDENYSAYRDKVGTILRQKARGTQISTADRREVAQMTEQISDNLQANIGNLRPQDYVAAKSFARELLAELQTQPSRGERANTGGLVAEAEPAGK